ncbi:hypothetical protein HDU97_008874 [Phlyctochytrium planicorne]|nr:hypothetical protein HDU97_008874 [Phlyctochytrium planicorne]
MMPYDDVQRQVVTPPNIHSIPTIVKRPATSRPHAAVPLSLKQRPQTSTIRRPATGKKSTEARSAAMGLLSTLMAWGDAAGNTPGKATPPFRSIQPESYILKGFSRPQTAPAAGPSVAKHVTDPERKPVPIHGSMKKVGGILRNDFREGSGHQKDFKGLHRATALDVLIGDAKRRDHEHSRPRSGNLWAQSLITAVLPLQEPAEILRAQSARQASTPSAANPINHRCKSAAPERQRDDPALAQSNYFKRRHHDLEDRLLGDLESSVTLIDLMQVNVEKLYKLTRKFLHKYQIEDVAFLALTARHDERVAAIEDDAKKSGEDKNGGGKKKARFEEQSEYLHEIFMWIVRACIDIDKPNEALARVHRERRRSRSRSRSASKIKFTDTFDRLIWNPGDMGNEEEEVPEGWNYLPNQGEEKSSGRATTGVYFAHRLPALDDVKGRGGQLRRILSAASRRPKDEVPPKVDSFDQPSGLTPEELARVREYVGRIAHQRRINKEGDKEFGGLTTLSLKDWERTNEGRDAIWDPSIFSVNRFISDYVSMYWKMYGYENAVQNGVMDAFEIIQSPNVPESLREPPPNSKRVNISGYNDYGSMYNIASARAKRTTSRATSSKAPSRAVSTMDGSNVPNRQRSTSRYDVTRRSAILMGDDNTMHRASEIPMMPLTDPWRYHHAECVAILKKPGWQRTTEEIRVVSKIMKSLSAFRNYSDFIIGQVSGSLRYQYVDASRVIIKQGDMASAWYIILSGSVNVKVSQTGRIEDSINVKTLYTGESFGDIALVNNETRAATIVTTEPCELVKIEKAEYDRVLKFIHEKEKTEMMNFLKYLDLFENWKPAALRSVAQTMTFRKILPGALIIEQGKDCTEFMLIREGVVVVFKSVMSNGQRHDVRVAVYGPGDYICEEGVIFEDSSEKHSRFTLRAGEGKDERDYEKKNGVGVVFEQIDGKQLRVRPKKKKRPGVVLAIIDAFDARKKFGQIIKAHPHLMIDEEGVMDMKRHEAMLVKWKRYRKSHVSTILTERRGIEGLR